MEAKKKLVLVDDGIISILAGKNALPDTCDLHTVPHEQWGGSGYPLGLAGTEIPLQGCLMVLADRLDEASFDAQG